jgi:hypothetical protein
MPYKKPGILRISTDRFLPLPDGFYCKDLIMIGGLIESPFPIKTDLFWTSYFSHSFRRNYNHVTFGTGVVVKSFTIDWAYDYSKNYKRFLLSTVVDLESLAGK